MLNLFDNGKMVVLIEKNTTHSPIGNLAGRQLNFESEWQLTQSHVSSPSLSFSHTHIKKEQYMERGSCFRDAMDGRLGYSSLFPIHRHRQCSRSLTFSQLYSQQLVLFVASLHQTWKVQVVARNKSTHNLPFYFIFSPSIDTVISIVSLRVYSFPALVLLCLNLFFFLQLVTYTFQIQLINTQKKYTLVKQQLLRYFNVDTNNIFSPLK